MKRDEEKAPRVPSQAALADWSRRDLAKTATPIIAPVIAGCATGAPAVRETAAADPGPATTPPDTRPLCIGMVGCGERGSGAVVQALNADKNTTLVAIAVVLATVPSVAGVFSCTGDITDPAAPSAGGEPGASRTDGERPPRTRPFVPGPGGLRRLTVEEYQNTVRDLLGQPLALPSDLEPDVVLFHFTSVGAASASVSERGIEQFETAAHFLADQVFGNESRRQTFVGCSPKNAADPCLQAFFKTFGRKAWRRPIERDELAGLVGRVGDVASASGSIWTGVQYGVAAMLQAPSFLFRSEIGSPDAADGTRRRLDGWEMASRLSYLLASTTPDDLLLEAAAQGRLDEADGIRAQARRLSSSAKTRGGLLRFFRELLELDNLSHLKKDPVLYPDASALGPAMKTEAEKMLENVLLTRNDDVRTLFDTRETFVNADLRKLYGLGSGGPLFSHLTLPAAGPRLGLIGLGGVLAIQASEVDSKPTRRGKFILSLLCRTVPPPPPNVNTQRPKGRTGTETKRVWLEDHRKDPTCASCHLATDPIGLALENFDAVGRYRTMENNKRIDASGQLDGKDFVGLPGLAPLLRATPDFPPCLVTHLGRFATGRIETPGEQPVIDQLNAAFASSGFRLVDLAIELAASDAFRFVGEPN